MEMLIVIIVVSLAAVYVGRTFYRQFSGKDGCSSGCAGCSVEMKNNCTSPHQAMNDLKLK